jgi:hypothetical protein
MADIFTSYISKLLINRRGENGGIIKVKTTAFSPSGDVFEFDERITFPRVIQTEDSIAELKPEVSEIYPYKIVLPIEEDGANFLRSPSVSTEVTASQNYYAPVYFERYNPEVLAFIDKEFKELPDPNLVEVPEEQINPFGEVDA